MREGTNAAFLKENAVRIGTLVLGSIFFAASPLIGIPLGEGVAFLLAGYPVLVSAARKLWKGLFFDEESLMSIASLGAIAIGSYAEAAAVMLFYGFGELLQESVLTRSREAIEALAKMRPESARLQREDGSEIVVAPQEVLVGQRIRVLPGERVPLDGVVVEGMADVDASSLTGESMPKTLSNGDKAFAGMVPLDGILVIAVERPYEESSLARILALVEESSSRKSKTERFFTRFSRVYTPAMLLLALCVATLPPLVIPGALFRVWVYRALVLLVISCPCALVLSIPLGYLGGIGNASRQGILVKGGQFLDALASVKTVVFDKTGTLTEGTFRIVGAVCASGVSKETLLEQAAWVESPSTHPIASCIRKASGLQLDPGRIEDFRSLPGRGVSGKFEGHRIVAGSGAFLAERKIPVPDLPQEGIGTVVHVAVDGAWKGVLYLADAIRPQAQKALEELRELGVSRFVMLTGDEKRTADEIGKALGIDEIRAELLPQDKVAHMERLATVAYLGDGINDAPALSRADVGIAMGGLGSDAALEAADVVLMDDDLGKLPRAIRISRHTRRIVRQNLVFSLGVKGLFLLLGIAGIAGIWEAVFADVGVCVLAVLNASRALFYRP